MLRQSPVPLRLQILGTGPVPAALALWDRGQLHAPQVLINRLGPLEVLGMTHWL